MWHLFWCLSLKEKEEKIIRIVPISPTEIKTKSIINKGDIETKYGIITYNPNKLNKKGNDWIMELNYTRTGDYESPNLTLNDNKKGTINKYGMLRLNHLKHYKKSLYTTLLMKDELTNHLVSVSKDAETLLNKLMKSYKKRDEKLSERNKEINKLEWVKLMNNYKNTAEEIIYLYWKYVRTYSHILSGKHWICTPIQILLWEFPYP